MSEGLKIELSGYRKNAVRVTAEDGGWIEAQSVEAILLYMILQELKDLNQKGGAA